MSFRLPFHWAALFLVLICGAPAAEPYFAVDPLRENQLPIVLPDREGLDWGKLMAPRLHPNSPEAKLRDAVLFLREGIERLTGTILEVVSGPHPDGGIMLTLLDFAPAEIRNDPAVIDALKNDGSDFYNDREAFFLRSEKNRLLVVANTVDGLVAGVPALLETVDYEVLAMGPNWIHVPPKSDRLVFEVEVADRPDFYLRRLTPTSGQSYGVGTIQTTANLQLSDPADESVSESYRRWAIAIRDRGSSMAPFPGHALYRHHRAMLAWMRRAGSTEGFLTAGNHLGSDADRPPPAEENREHLWINTDPEGSPEFEKVYLSNGSEWEEMKLSGLKVNLDLTSAPAREIVLEDLKQRAAAYFAEDPSEPLVYGTEAEDGAGYANIAEWSLPGNRNWYPEYLQSRGVPWPRDYVLHGYRGIDQPKERYDPAVPADVVFGFNNWLLAEFDRWIDSLPEAERVTRSGASKKDLLRLSFYSYAFHDIPPHHNLDPRIRVMIAGYPKHRGYGEWKNFATAQDVAGAFKVMLPREPSGIYRIISIAYYADDTVNGIPPKRSASAASVVNEWGTTLDAGIRALTCETDFNFGKYGLEYYLVSRFLWNARLTPDELDARRDRWLGRAYGSGREAMKQYYDFMLIDHFTVNAPASWANAIRYIENADATIDPAKEPDAQRRLDDLKQFWYFYYLLDSGRARPDSPEMIEFAWKGQMSYANAMHMVLKRIWNSRKVADVVPEEIRRGPAHYSPEETALWWKKILEHWPLVEVTQFSESKIADGRSGGEIDLNDLVRVKDFDRVPTRERPFLFNSAQAPATSFLTVAAEGEEIGFQFSWPAMEDQPPGFYGPMEVPYGIEYWDPKSREWQSIVDVTLSSAASRRVEHTYNGKPRHVVEVRHPAARPGTYRIEVGKGGLSCMLSGLGYDLSHNQFTERQPQTYFDRPRGLTQEPVYLYLPKGTRTLDLEVWDSYDRKKVELFRGIGAKGLIPSREIDISRHGTHRIAIEPGEDGNLARIGGNGFAFPVLYSVPGLWAKSPAELVIPRAIAEADRLEILK